MRMAKRPKRQSYGTRVLERMLGAGAAAGLYQEVEAGRLELADALYTLISDEQSHDPHWHAGAAEALVDLLNARVRELEARARVAKSD